MDRSKQRSVRVCERCEFYRTNEGDTIAELSEGSLAASERYHVCFLLAMDKGQVLWESKVPMFPMGEFEEQALPEDCPYVLEHMLAAGR